MMKGATADLNKNTSQVAYDGCDVGDSECESARLFPVSFAAPNEIDEAVFALLDQNTESKSSDEEEDRDWQNDVPKLFSESRC